MLNNYCKAAIIFICLFTPNLSIINSGAIISDKEGTIDLANRRVRCLFPKNSIPSPDSGQTGYSDNALLQVYPENYYFPRITWEGLVEQTQYIIEAIFSDTKTPQERTSLVSQILSATLPLTPLTWVMPSVINATQWGLKAAIPMFLATNNPMLSSLDFAAVFMGAYLTGYAHSLLHRAEALTAVDGDFKLKIFLNEVYTGSDILLGVNQIHETIHWLHKQGYLHSDSFTSFALATAYHTVRLKEIKRLEDADLFWFEKGVELMKASIPSQKRQKRSMQIISSNPLTPLARISGRILGERMLNRHYGALLGGMAWELAQQTNNSRNRHRYLNLILEGKSPAEAENIIRTENPQ